MGEPYTVRTRGYGLPDYSQPQPLGQVAVGPVHTSTDIGELAARLGSIVTFDRRGNVIWLNDFESGIGGFEIGTNGPDASVISSSHAARSGFLCARAIPGNIVDGYAQLMKVIPYPHLSSIGLEISLIRSPSVQAYYEFAISLYDTETLYQGVVRYFATNNIWCCINSSGVFQNIATLPMRRVTSLFHTIKLVIDFVNKKYVRLIVNNKEYDLSSISLNSFADPSGPYMITWVSCADSAGGGDISHATYLDDFILTQNEPPNL